MQALRTHIRWMIRMDMPAVVQIEADSFEQPWTEENFLHCFRQRNVIGMVAEDGDTVVGYVLYELHKHRLNILNMAVAPQYRHRGIGQQMVEKIAGKLTTMRRQRITLQVRETNLEAQLFFRATGFKCVGCVRGFYEDTDEASYLFRRTLRTEVTA